MTVETKEFVAAVIAADDLGLIDHGGFGPDGEPCDCEDCAAARRFRAAREAYDNG